jgi:hypothetical protein
MRTLENLTVLEWDYSRSRVSWSNYTKINSYPSIALYHHFDFTRVLHTRLGCYLLQKLEAAVSRRQPHHRLLRRKYHYKQVLASHNTNHVRTVLVHAINLYLLLILLLLAAEEHSGAEDDENCGNGNHDADNGTWKKFCG